jgi:hypothetical protein
VTTTSPTSRPRSVPTAEQILPFRTEGCPAEAEQLLKQGLVRPVIADVLVAFDAPDSWQIRASAASLLIPAEVRANASWVVGFGSAAWLHTGFTSIEHPPSDLQVIVSPGRRRPKRAGIRGRQVALTPDQVVYLGSVPVTDPVRTAADVARDLPADQAVAALHRLGELCGVRPEHVLQVLGTMRYARGAATARQVIKTWTEA